MGIDADGSWLTLHEDMQAPASFLLARDGAWAMVSVSGLFFLWAFVATLTRYLELRRAVTARMGKGKTRAVFQKRVVGWMLVNTGFNVMQQLLNTFMYGSAAAAKSAIYCDFAQKRNAFFFMGAMWGNYMVLAIRARTTSTGAGKLHQLLQWATETIALVGVPIIMIAAAILFRGRVLFGAVCTQELPIAITSVFTMADSSLSLMLLVLFVLPVTKHLRNVAKVASASDKVDQETLKLRRIAVKNMKLSAVQIMTTFAVLLFGVLTQAFFDDEQDPSLSYWRCLRFIFYSMALAVNTMSLMMMSNAWVPESWSRLRTFLERYLEDDKDETDGARATVKVQPGRNSAALALSSLPASTGAAGVAVQPVAVSPRPNLDTT